ncbi:TVP38/TMEM64 family protein [Rubritalea marina]|uniref:TVP38/TMEM64 family protein n=1 Tax=Rubritalea marina TaxID=361055 RepID=UPI00037BF1CB|nr:VTT domain-containing protein [Rubritalea marina]
MTPLIKTALWLVGFFLGLFVLLQSTGWLTQEEIEAWLRSAHDMPKVWIGIIIVALLVADILLAVPGIVVVSLAGYFLGPFWGAFCGSLGLTLAGVVGYGLCRAFGEPMLHRLFDKPEMIEDMRASFHKHGALALMLSRAAPMLPEVTSCLAGVTKMRFSTYLLSFGTSCTLYSIAVAYAGSLSSAENVTPAIIAYFCIMLVLWVSWFSFTRKQRKKSRQE